MPLNIFEGARRLALFVGILYALAVIGFTINMRSDITIQYDIKAPNLPWVRVSTSANCGEDDRWDGDTKTTSQGTSYAMWACFRAQKFPDGRMLVPYKVESGKVSGDSAYSTAVTVYVKRSMRDFQPPASDERWIGEQAGSDRWQRVQTAGEIVVGGLVGWWIVVTVIGWIVRGFLGIPRGRDSRPE